MSVKDECHCCLEEMIPKKCVICRKEGLTQSNPVDKYGSCPQHKSKAISMCGYGEYVCQLCGEEGWYSTAGTGGGTYHFNAKTIQRKLQNGDIIDVSHVF
jgi:hypothetical protein